MYHLKNDFVLLWFLSWLYHFQKLIRLIWKIICINTIYILFYYVQVSRMSVIQLSHYSENK